MGAITPLVAAGSDAFTNLYDVDITFPTDVEASPTTAGGASQLSISVRISGFTPPELKPTTYKSEYKGVSISRISPTIEGDRKFDIEYRIDANYELHTKLMKWKHIIMDPSGEGNINFDGVFDGVLGDVTKTGTVKVRAYSGLSHNLTDFGSESVATASSGYATGWEFYNVICISAGNPSLKRVQGAEATAKAEFIFIKCIEPGSSLTKLEETPPIKMTL